MMAGIDTAPAPTARRRAAGGCTCAGATGAGTWACCDTSPSQHATAHLRTTGHPLVRSFEPGERWYRDYRTDTTFERPDLAEHRHRPADQPVPGPAGRVPADRRRHIH
jgi:hypothetical protein